MTKELFFILTLEFPLIDLASLHALEIRILRVYQNDANAEQSDAQLQKGAGIGEGQVRRAVEWLISKQLLEVTGENTRVTVSLTEVGRDFASKGATPEAALLTRASAERVGIQDLQADERFDRGAWGSAFGGLKKDGIIDLDKGAIVIVDADRASFFVDRLMPELFAKFSDTGIEIGDFPSDIAQYIEAHARKRGGGRGPCSSGRAHGADLSPYRRRTARACGGC